MSTNDAERLDEELMVRGFTWREAAAITNEYLNPVYTIYGRVQLAEDIAKARRKVSADTSEKRNTRMRELSWDEVVTVMAEFSLPPLPEFNDTDEDYRDLILFTQGGPSVILTQCSREDAMEYCQREDTHGGDWFVGFSNPE